MLPMEMSARVKAVKDSASFMKGRRHAAISKADSLSTEVATLETNVDKYEKATKVIAALVDKMVQKDLQDIDNLVNYGLKIVFPDRDLLFKSSMVMVGNKMQVDFTTYDTGDEVSDDAHGSVSVIESLLLRIICMMKTKTGKMLLLDETFGALDSDYIQALGNLLRTLSEKTKTDILLVTFNGMLSDAHTLLRAKLNHNTKELRIVDGRS
jgi:DNA repair exonuclease SbcCD ATPase subunit